MPKYDVRVYATVCMVTRGVKASSHLAALKLIEKESDFGNVFGQSCVDFTTELYARPSEGMVQQLQKDSTEIETVRHFILQGKRWEIDQRWAVIEGA